MSKIIKGKDFKKLITEIKEYRKELDTFFEGKKIPKLKSFKEYLVDREMKNKLTEMLNNAEVGFSIEAIVFEENNDKLLLENQLLLEWEKYKKIPKTNLTYRYDAGKAQKGMDDHIHVFAGNSKNQLYAINRPGTPHDGSKAKLSSKEINFLKSIGFTPPKDGILEWYDLPSDKKYVAYNRILLG